MSIATEFVVGHPEMDAQHNAIQHLVRDVHQAMGAEDLPETLRALEALWNGCVSHFANEDSLMEEYAYPERNPHRTAHHLFLEDLKELLRVAQRDGLTENVATWARKRSRSGSRSTSRRTTRRWRGPWRRRPPPA